MEKTIFDMDDNQVQLAQKKAFVAMCISVGYTAVCFVGGNILGRKLGKWILN